MQRLINANDLEVMPIDITDLPYDKCLMVYYAEDVDNAPTVLEIPDNPTNGDIIKAMFPQAKIYQSGGYTNCNFKGGTFLEDKRSEWWNAPYKPQESEETDI